MDSIRVTRKKYSTYYIMDYIYNLENKLLFIVNNPQYKRSTKSKIYKYNNKEYLIAEFKIFNLKITDNE